MMLCVLAALINNDKYTTIIINERYQNLQYQECETGHLSLASKMFKFLPIIINDCCVLANS